MTSGFLQHHDTSLGSIWSVWTNAGLFQVQLQKPSTDNLIELESRNCEIEKHVDQFDQVIRSYAQSGEATFEDIKIDPTGWTKFSRRVYDCCRQIPPGETVTYKELATRSGNAAASRAVGAAMARNRVLLVIPCHRVVASNGQLRGFSAPGGLVTKQRLLDLEQPSNRSSRQPSQSQMKLELV